VGERCSNTARPACTTKDEASMHKHSDNTTKPVAPCNSQASNADRPVGVIAEPDQAAVWFDDETIRSMILSVAGDLTALKLDWECETFASRVPA
jgi:hypothetical protein